MSPTEIKKLGMYLIRWKSGGTSVASVGQDAKGNLWYAPSNWIAVPGWDWDIIESVTHLGPHRADNRQVINGASYEVQG